MAATSEEEKIGSEMLDRAHFDGLFVPRTIYVDDDVLTVFAKQVNAGAGTGFTQNTGPGAWPQRNSLDQAGANLAAGFATPNILGSTTVTEANYAVQVQLRAQVANQEFQKILLRTNGDVTRRILAYFLGLGLTDTLGHENPDENVTVIAMLCRNSNVTASSVRLALGLIEGADLEAASEATEYFTPLGLAIIAAVRAQESDTKTQTFGDNAVEKARVLLEHGAWMCEQDDDDKDGISMPEFLERLEAGHASIESIDLVAMDKLKTIAKAQTKRREAVTSSSSYKKGDPIRTHAIEHNPIYPAYRSAVTSDQVAAFFESLNSERDWDKYVDSVDNIDRLPIIWYILKQHLAGAKEANGRAANEQTAGTLLRIGPAFDALLHWYLVRKSASNEFKFDSVACIFWFCVGAWRRFGANNFDINLNQEAPFPLFDVGSSASGDVADDFPLGDFYYTENGAQTSWDATRQAREALNANLFKISQILQTEGFEKNLSESMTKVNELSPPPGMAVPSEAGLSDGTKQTGYKMTALRMVRQFSIDNNVPVEDLNQLRDYLNGALNFNAAQTMPTADFFYRVSRLALEGASKMHTLYEVLLKMDFLDADWAAQNPGAPYLRIDREQPIDATASTVSINPISGIAGTFKMSYVLTFLQYGVLVQLARHSHHHLTQKLVRIDRAIRSFHALQNDAVVRALKQLADDLKRVALDLRFLRIVAGAIALTLGVRRTNNVNRLEWGKIPAFVSRDFAYMSNAIARTSLKALMDAINAFKTSNAVAAQTSDALTAIENDARTDGYDKIKDLLRSNTALIGESVNLTNVSLKMPFSLKDVSRQVNITHTAQVFAVIPSFSTAMERYSEQLFADPTSYGNRLDTRDPGDIWPQIPGALM